MTTLPNMGIILPTAGGDVGTWDDKLDAGLTLIDAHDHTSGKGARITPAAININANLGFGGYAITAAGQVAFTAVAALTSGSKALFVSSVDNELYWRTNTGTNVKLTSGTSLNTSLVGGIVGDYTAAGAEVAFDDAGQRYTFKRQGAPKPWARLASGSVRIFEHNTTESVFVGLNTPAALATSYDMTFATALPASQALVQIGSTGQLVYSNTLAANQSIVVSGTGRYKHGDITEYLAGFAGALATGAVAYSSANPPGPSIVIPSSTSVLIPIPMAPGQRLKAVFVYAPTPVAVITYTLYRAGSAVATTMSFGSPDIGCAKATLTAPIASVDDGFSPLHWLKIEANATGSVNIYAVARIYDHP